MTCHGSTAEAENAPVKEKTNSKTTASGSDSAPSVGDDSARDVVPDPGHRPGRPPGAAPRRLTLSPPDPGPLRNTRFACGWFPRVPACFSGGY